MKKIMEKIWNGVAICFGVVLGIAFFGWLAGALAIWLLNSLLPKFPFDAVMPPANDIADWRSLVVIAIGCVVIACFLLIRSLVSAPLGALIEKSFTRLDAIAARGRVPKWIGLFILSAPSFQEIQAAQKWNAVNKAFDKKIVTGEYRGNSQDFEAHEHAIRKQKKALPSYPRLKTAGKRRAYLIGTPVCLFLALVLFASQSQPDVDDQETPDNQEVVDRTTSVRWFENSVLRRWGWNLTLVCSAVGLPLAAISWLSEKRYLKMLGADARYVEDDDEIYVADPTNFESWRQAFIERHGHDMSAEEEKKLRTKVDEVVDAYEQERAALRKLSEKIDEMRP